MERDCEHGSLARSCRECELLARIAELEAERCQHRVKTALARAGQCERCHRDVVANGCGPGFVFASEIGDRTGWQVCSDGLARWFGAAR